MLLRTYLSLKSTSGCISVAVISLSPFLLLSYLYFQSHKKRYPEAISSFSIHLPIGSVGSHLSILLCPGGRSYANKKRLCSQEGKGILARERTWFFPKIPGSEKRGRSEKA